MNYHTFGSQDELQAAVPGKRGQQQFADDASFNEVIGQAPWGLMHWRLCLFMCFAEVAISSMIEIVPLIMRTLAHDFELSKPMVSLTGGLLLLGGILGTLVGAYGCDMYGRKTTLIGATTFALFTTVVQVMVPGETESYWIFCVFRALLGVSFGSMICTAKPYYTEFLAVENRGRNLNIVGLGWGAGTFYCILIAWIYQDSWRVCILFSVLPLAIVGFMLICPGFLPESPRWLYVNGKEEEGRQVVHDLWRGRLDCSKFTLGYDSQDAEEKLGSWRSRLQQTLSPRFFRTTLVCAACYACVSGGNYGVNTWRVFFIAPDAKELPAISLWIMEGCGLIGFIPFLFFIDVCGRRPILILGFVLSAILAFAAAVTTKVVVDPHAHFVWMTIWLGLIQASTCLCWGGVGTIVMEAFPTYCRGTAFGISNCCIRISGAFFSFITGMVIELEAYFALSMVGMIFSVGIICSYLLNVETTNVPIEDFVDAVRSVRTFSFMEPSKRGKKTGEKSEVIKSVIEKNGTPDIPPDNNGPKDID